MKLEKLRGIAAARTKGRWSNDFLCITPDGKDAIEIVSEECGGVSYRVPDATFVATMANHANALLDVVEAAENIERPTGSYHGTEFGVEEYKELRAALTRLEQIDGDK